MTSVLDQPRHDHSPEIGVLGYLDGRAVPRTRLDERLSRLRSGAGAALLPVPGSAEDRQLARWVAQVILTEELCAAEAGRLGLAIATGSACELVMHRAAAVELGSILAAAWANSAAVRALLAERSATIVIDDAAVHAYWEATTISRPVRWSLRHQLDDGPFQRLDSVSADELPAAIAAGLAGAAVGTTFEVSDAIGRHTVELDAWWPAREPNFDDDAPRLREQLLASAGRAAFVRWLDAALAARVRTVPGLEHPGDPDQPDNHHKH